MCGQYGVIAPPGEALDSTDFSILRMCMVANEKRGDDSTGVAGVSENDIQTAKDIVPGSAFTLHQDYRNIESAQVQRALGHTRMATTGAVTARNAHPFTYSGESTVVGTHNGQVSNWKSYLKDFPNMQVDSEVIFGLLSRQLQVQEIWSQDPWIDGSFACAWVEWETMTPWLMRRGNPLFTLQDRNRNRLYYSSLSGCLLAGAAAFVPERMWSIAELQDNSAYRVDDPTGEWERFALEPSRPTQFYYPTAPSTTARQICNLCGEETWMPQSLCWACQQAIEGEVNGQATTLITGALSMPADECWWCGQNYRLSLIDGEYLCHKCKETVT